MAVTAPELSPLHCPNSSTTGIARHANESAYPELWKGHLCSVVPCLFGFGRIIPTLGDPLEHKYVSIRGLRSWGINGTLIGSDMSPVGEGVNWESGGDVHTKSGFGHLVPWSSSERPHTYTMVIRVTASAGSLTYEYLYANNPRLTFSANWKGETICFNTYTMTPQIWAGGNTSSVVATGNSQVFTQDNTIVEDQWHGIAIRVNDWSTTSISMAIDGEMYPAGSMTTGGSYSGIPVYSNGAAIRLGFDPSRTTQDLSCALFQVWDRGLTDQEMCQHTSDPTAMFFPRSLISPSLGKAPAVAGTKEVFLGRLAGMSEDVLAGTSQ